MTFLFNDGPSQNTDRILKILKKYNAKATFFVTGCHKEYNQYIIGRMGIPYKDKQVSVISVIVDGPNDIIGALSGKLGMVEGVSVKALYSKKENE